MHQPSITAGERLQLKTIAESPSSPTPPGVAPTTLRHSAYVALLQRGIAAGLTMRELANALAEATGAAVEDVIAELRSLDEP